MRIDGKVLIAPFTMSQGGISNAKNYHRWGEVVELLRRKGVGTVQLATNGDPLIGADETHGASIAGVKEMLATCTTWASIDSFLQHLANVIGKRGVVVFGPSNPSIFGYANNINLTSSPPRFREHQFAFWKDVPADPSSFPEPRQVFDAIMQLHAAAGSGEH